MSRRNTEKKNDSLHIPVIHIPSQIESFLNHEGSRISLHSNRRNSLNFHWHIERACQRSIALPSRHGFCIGYFKANGHCFAKQSPRGMSLWPPIRSPCKLVAVLIYPLI